MRMKVSVGMLFQARGGWTAKVVWIRADKEGFYAVHCPGIVPCWRSPQNERTESSPVFHNPNGRASCVFSINSLPAYDGHPADLDMKNYEL